MATPETVGIWNGARREMEEEGWKLVRTLRGGTKAMRDARELYTPKTEAEMHRPAKYDARLKRSVLYPAHADRVKAIASLPFQREPTIEGELPEPLDRIVSDADRSGTSLAAFGQEIYADAIERGVAYYLVDTVPLGEVPLPQKDAADARPYFVRIAPDNLIGFQTTHEHGRPRVTELRYRDWSWRRGTDGIDRLVDTVRVWDEVNVTIWERVTEEQVIDREAKAAQGARSIGSYVLVSTKAHGYPDGIPLVAVYTNKVDTLHGTPALMALADLNVAHWNSWSTQCDSVAYSRHPIKVISGASSAVAESKPQADAGSTIVDKSPDLSVSFAEPAGTSLQAGEREADRIEAWMMSLGMRPLVAAQGPETATGEVRADMSEKSEAQTWVEGLEWAIYQGFEKAAKWEGVELPEDFDITLFKDSSLIAGKATDMPVLLEMMRQGILTKKAFLQEVKARGVLVTVDDIDEMLEELEAEKDASVERQMQMFADRAIADRGEEGEGEESEEGDPDEEEDGEGMPPGMMGKGVA